MVEAAHQIAIGEAELARRRDAEERHARFAALVERQTRFLFRVAYAVLRNVQDSEDAVQETFLKIYRTGAWERITDERAFLAKTAWRVALSKVRKVHTEEVGPALATNDVSPEMAVLEADWNATIHCLIDALPDELRQPLSLSTVEALTSREIAEVLGLPEGSVRTRLMRARQVLREKLARLMESRNAK